MSHAKEPPRLPEVIVDEAGDSPRWLPLVGLGLLAAAALLVAVHQATGGSADTTPAPNKAPAGEPAAPPAAPAAANGAAKAPGGEPAAPPAAPAAANGATANGAAANPDAPSAAALRALWD
jgi:hypothetical protein